MRQFSVLLLFTLLCPRLAPGENCSRALRVSVALTIRTLRQNSSEKKEQAFRRQKDAANAAIPEHDPDEVVPGSNKFFRGFYPTELENLLVTRDLIGGLARYFDQHGELISKWAKEMSHFILGLAPQSEENLMKWCDMSFPPKPRRMAAPDLLGHRQHAIETSSPDDVSLVEYLEHSDEMHGGLPDLVEQAYHGAIHHHMDSILYRRQAEFQRLRASLLKQRRQKIAHVVIFFSPTKEQQEIWAKELTKDRWKDVPRVYIGATWDPSGWIVNPEFLSQIDRARINVLLPKEEGLRTRVETITAVASGMTIDSFSTDILITRSRLGLPGDPLTVKVADLRVGKKGDPDDLGNIYPFYPQLMAMDDGHFSEELGIFAEKFPFLSDERERMTYTARRGDPVELELQGLEDGALRVLFYSFDRISGK